MDNYAWEAIVNKEINAFSMAGMVDFGKTIIVEITEEQAKNEYKHIAIYDKEKDIYYVTAYEIINVRLLAVSLVSRGANLEPRFPLIKSIDGVWKPTCWNKALEHKSGGVTSFVQNVVDSIKPMSQSDSVDNKNLDNSEEYTMLTKEDIQKMISDAITSLKAEIVDMATKTKSATTDSDASQDSKTATTTNYANIEKIAEGLQMVGNAVKELKATVDGHTKEFQDIEKNFLNIENTFKQLNGEPIQDTKTDDNKNKSDSGDTKDVVEQNPDAIQKINDKVDGFIASFSKLFNAPSGGTHSDANSGLTQSERTKDDELFANLV